VCEQLVNAHTKSFTATFRTKVDENDVRAELMKASAAQLKEGKTLA